MIQVYLLHFKQQCAYYFVHVLAAVSIYCTPPPPHTHTSLPLPPPPPPLKFPQGASVAEIRRQYRRLSKVYHPDKEGGDQAMFMRIAKAYEA